MPNSRVDTGSHVSNLIACLSVNIAILFYLCYHFFVIEHTIHFFHFKNSLLFNTIYLAYKSTYLKVWCTHIDSAIHLKWVQNLKLDSKSLCMIFISASDLNI